MFGAGGAYDLGYHVVWCPKYRRAVLIGPVRGRLDMLIRAKCGEDQARWSFSSRQATLRRLDKAFVAFFRRARVGERAGLSSVQGRRLVRHGGMAEGWGWLPLGLPT